MAELDLGPYEAHGERISFTGVGGVEIAASYAVPAVAEIPAADLRGLVLHPDFMGLRPLFDDMSWRLATHGFAVICPDPFVHLPAEVRNGEDPVAKMRAVAGLDDKNQIQDLISAADRLATLTTTTTMNITGFCLGGMQTLKAATTGRFDRAVSFYGQLRLPPEWQGGTMMGPMGNLDQVCPTLAILGGVDPYTPAADVLALREEWRDRPDCEIFSYPEADHAFVHDPNRPTHRAADAADAWRRTLDWFSY